MGIDAPIDPHSRSAHGLMCRFGQKLVDAHRVSFEEIQCVAPSFVDADGEGGEAGDGGREDGENRGGLEEGPESVALSVSRNGVEYSPAPERYALGYCNFPRQSDTDKVER